jgi:hypothetical protein
MGLYASALKFLVGEVIFTYISTVSARLESAGRLAEGVVLARGGLPRVAGRQPVVAHPDAVFYLL